MRMSTSKMKPTRETSSCNRWRTYSNKTAKLIHFRRKTLILPLRPNRGRGGHCSTALRWMTKLRNFLSLTKRYRRTKSGSREASQGWKTKSTLRWQRWVEKSAKLKITASAGGLMATAAALSRTSARLTLRKIKIDESHQLNDSSCM